MATCLLSYPARLKGFQPLFHRGTSFLLFWTAAYCKCTALKMVPCIFFWGGTFLCGAEMKITGKSIESKKLRHLSWLWMIFHQFATFFQKLQLHIWKFSSYLLDFLGVLWALGHPHSKAVFGAARKVFGACQVRPGEGRYGCEQVDGFLVKTKVAIKHWLIQIYVFP